MIRVTTESTGVAGGPWYSTFHFGGSTEGEAAAAVAAVDGYWENLRLMQCTPLVNSTLGDVPQIDPATGEILQMFTVTPSSATATITSEAWPLAAQALVQWRTGVYVGGRELRGRTFIPYLTVAASQDGELDSGYRSTILTYTDTFLGAAGAAGNLVVYSRTHHVASQVTGRDVWRQIAVLRSRRD